MTKKISSAQEYNDRKARRQRRQEDPLGAIVDPIMTACLLGLVGLLVVGFIVGVISAVFGG